MIREDRNYRKEIVDVIMSYAREMKGLSCLYVIWALGLLIILIRAPDRIYNMGIMEQGTVGIAAGMAMTGLIPVVYSIVNFLAYRALEQIRNDVILQNLNVKFIATGVNDYFKFLGPSHCCGEDDKKIMQLINMKVCDPYEVENIDFNKMVEKWITDAKAGYIRV